MDPFSRPARLLTITQFALELSDVLIRNIRDSRHASKEKRLLAEEANSLAKLLRRLSDRAEASRSETWLSDYSDIVQQFEAAFNDLAWALKVDVTTGEPEKEGRLNAILAAASWSFSKAEVYNLLHRVERLQQYATALLADEQHALLESLDRKQHEALDQQVRASIVSWLTPVRVSQIHQTISDRAEKGSGQWLLDSFEFLKWKECPDAQLWCWGIPGAGKTVIASTVVNHLRQTRSEDQKAEIGIAVLYLKYNAPDQTINGLLRSLIRQLVQESKSFPPELIELYEQHRGRNTALSRTELVAVLQSTLDTLDQVFFVVGGLDECAEELRWDLIDELDRLKGKLRLIVTSPYQNSIDEELATFNRVEIKANRADIELFIDHQIKKNRNLRKLLEKSPSLRTDIKSAVVTTAQHMFLLARLHVESLASAAGLSVRHVRRKLRTLPNTLTGTYDSAMQRIEEQELDHRKIALKILAWVTYAFCPLSLQQLQHAIAIEPGDPELDEELITEGHNISMLCAGLLIIDKRSSMVNLVHYSTKSYFDDRRQTLFPDFHAIVTLSCATYLTLKSLQNLPVSQIVQRYPLAYYAARYLGDHARQTPEEALTPSTLEAICRLLADPDKRRPLLSLLYGLDLIRAGFYSMNQAEEGDGGGEKSTTLPNALALLEPDADPLSTPRDTEDWDSTDPPTYSRLSTESHLTEDG
jgi:Cdc6-like AAA superfamily ATPase